MRRPAKGGRAPVSSALALCALALCALALCAIALCAVALCAVALCAIASCAAVPQASSRGTLDGRPGDVQRIVLLPPGPDNPRNSEGDFIRLADGRLMFVYTHFFGGEGDHSSAYLAARFSSDLGLTWTVQDKVVVKNEGDWNVMSVSLLRLHDNRIALFYLRKNSLSDCRVYLRTSQDETESWTEPRLCIQDQVGYYVMNNDRAVQLADGRLVLPVALHNLPEYEQPDWAGRLMCYLSDDAGDTWRRSTSVLTAHRPDGRRVTVQEPGVVELIEGRLMMFCRSDAGSQYVSYSQDAGDTWSPLVPSAIVSPLSPASIERIPSTGDLLLVWNDHEGVDRSRQGKRTPYRVAVSVDEGVTWTYRKTIEDDPDGWYCYTAIEFVDGAALLGHCAGNRRNGNGLETTQITRFSLDWLYR